MKQIGTFYWSEDVQHLSDIREPRTGNKPVWGDVYKGDDDNDVLLWGIVNFNIPADTYEHFKTEFEKLREQFKETTDYKLKKKEKHSRHGDYVKLYIPRPADKMNEVVDELQNFDFTSLNPEQPTTFEIEIEEENFDKIKRAEVSKAI